MPPLGRTFLAAALGFAISIFPVHPSTDLHAGGRRRAVAVAPPTSELTLTFLDGPVLDTGPIVWRGERRKTTRVTRTAVLRIGLASQEAHGTATLRAFLETPDPRATVRVDGLLLSTSPRVVQRFAPIGIAVTHRIEIEVPVDAAEGPLAASIGWEVTTD